jgi:hypothetical protein
MDMLETWKPADRFPYQIVTTAMMEHSHGVAWKADLMLGTVKIGTVEQMGDGGADRVYITEPAYALVWKMAVMKAWPGREFFSAQESATLWLMAMEDQKNEMLNV